jgi:hypothetical protein
MKTKYELETIKIFDVKLDVYFTYDDYFGFSIKSIEDVQGTQNLYPIIDDYYEEAILEELATIYRGRGIEC